MDEEEKTRGFKIARWVVDEYRDMKSAPSAEQSEALVKALEALEEFMGEHGHWRAA